MHLILASQSPRRRELLATLGLKFDILQADIDETPLDAEHPVAMTERLAIAKAKHILDQTTDDVWVLGGDTTVALNEVSFGKPRDRQQAMSMLAALSDNTHQVVSAIALVNRASTYTATSISNVTFATLSSAQISTYCDSGDPFDKAGGYGIQGYAGCFVSHLSGSYSGVVGLPLYETRMLLQQAGLL